MNRPKNCALNWLVKHVLYFLILLCVSLWCHCPFRSSLYKADWQKIGFVVIVTLLQMTFPKAIYNFSPPQEPPKLLHVDHTMSLTGACRVEKFYIISNKGSKSTVFKISCQPHCTWQCSHYIDLPDVGKTHRFDLVLVLPARMNILWCTFYFICQCHRS